MNYLNKEDVGFSELFELVKEDWITQTSLMTDKELMEDRNDWVKKYGIYEDDSDDMKRWTDIRTISIMLEQIRRFSGVIYDI